MKSFTPVVNYKEHSLLSVMPAEAMLSHVKIKNFLKQIEQRVYLTPEQFEKTYVELVKNFAEMVQALPVVEGGELGALFAEGLHRAWYAVQAISESGEQDQLHIFAVFSSALLLDTRKIFLNRRVFISNPEGEFISEWIPFQGSMLKIGAEFYKIRFYQRPIEHISPYVSLLLAYEIMPKAAFLWLASDLRFLNMWMAALSGDEEGSGGLAHYLKIAKERLDQIKNANFILPVEVTAPEQTEAGEAFWTWLKNTIAEGEVVTPGVYNVEDYIFLEAENIFQEFNKQQANKQNWQNIREQFLKLGIAASTQTHFDPKQPEKALIFINKDELPQIEKALGDIAAGRKSFFNKQADSQRVGGIKGQEALDRNTMREGFLMTERKLYSKVSQKLETNKIIKAYVEKQKEKNRLHGLDAYLEKAEEAAAKAQVHFSSK